MSIQLHSPKGFLSQFVEYIGFLSGNDIGTGVAFPRMNQVIIINIGTNFNTSDVYSPKSEVLEVNSKVWINGKHDIPFMLGNKGITAMFAIGLKAGMLPYFANLPACETNDQAVDAINWTSKEIFNLREQLAGCADITSAFQLIEQYLLNIIQQRDLSNLEKIKWLSAEIHKSSVTEICRTLGVTRKKLRSDAQYYFGSSVKSIQGIIRFNQTLASIAHHADQPLSGLHEYYDQAHFINDFKARTGLTPLQYKRLCQQLPAIKYTPNFIALKKEAFLKFISAK